MARMVLTLLLVCHFLVADARAQRKVEVSAQQVDKAIKEVRDYLLGLQRRNGPQAGTWEGHEGAGNGQTALMALALLTSGLEPNHPSIRAALEYLRRTEPNQVYDAALQVMVFCAANPQRDLERITRLVRKIEKAQLEDDGWAYDLGNGAGRSADQSNSQFAALSLWEAQRVGIKVNRETLLRVAKYWRDLQFRHGPQDPATGGWAYKNGLVTGSMTSAGIASLIMAEDAVSIADAAIKDDVEILCCGVAKKNEVPNAELGLQWLARNFTANDNPGSANSYLMYYLYGVERVGRLTGQRLLGNHDWYREGCESILQKRNTLKGNIEWPDSLGISTNSALSLLFLSKGKRQIVIARAMLPEDRIEGLDQQYSFRKHSHAVNHLNGHLEQAWKRDLSWQSIALEQSTVQELLESPVLFISGSRELVLSEQAQQNLKEYVEQGGFVFAEACNGNGCDGTAFDKSFRELMAKLFESPLKKLDSSHAVWGAQVPVDVSKLPKEFWLYGIESCCRTAVMYSPISLACRWELNKAYGLQIQASPKVMDELDAAVAVGLNVVTYATGRQLKDRLQAPEVVMDKSETVETERGTFRLPRLRHAGGDDDTPQAVPRMLSAYKEAVQTLVDTESPLLTPTSPALKEQLILYISGRNAFKYSEADREALRSWFEKGGGVLLGDSVCASAAFTESLKKELAQILPGSTWESVESTDPLLTNDFNGFDIRSVTIVDPGNQGGPVSLSKREGPPVLERLVYKQRTVCIFSPYDISCALESRGSTQCLGYIRADAARIGVNMMIYALSNGG